MSVFLVIGAALVSCSGGYTGPSPAQCLAVMAPSGLYPSNGATGIPDGNFDLFVGYGTNPTQSWGVPVLTATNATQGNGTIFTPAIGPPPNGATPPPGDQAFVSHIPPLFALTTYSVTLPGGACGAAFLGTFTTQ